MSVPRSAPARKSDNCKRFVVLCCVAATGAVRALLEDRRRVAGQRVKRGQKIAYVGSTGPHLHYEVWVNHKAVDTLKYVMPDAIVD